MKGRTKRRDIDINNLRLQHDVLYKALKKLLEAKEEKERYGKTSTYEDLKQEGWEMAEEAVYMVKS